MFQEMDEFCRIKKKNMFLTIREGIAEILHEFEHQLGKAVGRKDTAAKKPEVRRPNAFTKEEE